jgi:hypothetical protein
LDLIARHMPRLQSIHLDLGANDDFTDLLSALERVVRLPAMQDASLNAWYMHWTWARAERRVELSLHNEATGARDRQAAALLAMSPIVEWVELHFFVKSRRAWVDLTDALNKHTPRRVRIDGDIEEVLHLHATWPDHVKQLDLGPFEMARDIRSDLMTRFFTSLEHLTIHDNGYLVDNCCSLTFPPRLVHLHIECTAQAVADIRLPTCDRLSLTLYYTPTLRRFELTVPAVGGCILSVNCHPTDVALRSITWTPEVKQRMLGSAPLDSGIREILIA